MHPVSQIIERNLRHREDCESGLLINPEQDDCWSKMEENCRSLKLFSQDFSAYSYLLEMGADIEFSAFPQVGTKKFNWIILNLPRQKALLGMMLDCAASMLAEDGVLWLAGENRAGIKSADKLLKLYFGKVRKLDNARHCSLYEACGRVTQGSFQPAAYRQEWTLNCNDAEIKVISYPGVFAHGRLDPGTALLLNALAEMRLEGDVLDFACGSGLIGACIAANHEHANVTLLDSSALALKASRETLAENQLNGTVLASDGLSELEGSFDVIVSNPPIHAGIRTDNSLSMRLLEPVYEHINPGGILVMVSNIHLPYEGWLSQKLKRCSEILANDNYKVIVAKK